MFEQKLKSKENLSRYTTFKIGGLADYFFIAKNIEDLNQAVAWSRQNNRDYFILAGGSNLLISDEGYRGLVIKLELNNFQIEGPRITAQAGALLGDVVEAAIEHGLSGLVWASGIPGSIGGAIRGNAGAYGGEIKDSIESVTVMRDGKTLTLLRSDIIFAYRDSQFKHSDDVILSATLKLAEGADRAELKKESLRIIGDRAAKHSPRPSAGSFFKNILITEVNREKLRAIGVPEQCWQYGKVPAGFLLDKLGFKGQKLGGAMVFENHANIIINTGAATAADVLALAEEMKSAVLSKYGIELESEVVYINGK